MYVMSTTQFLCTEILGSGALHLGTNVRGCNSTLSGHSPIHNNSGGNLLCHSEDLTKWYFQLMGLSLISTEDPTWSCLTLQKILLTWVSHVRRTMAINRGRSLFVTPGEGVAVRALHSALCTSFNGSLCIEC
jgi:hypothetical protein